MHTYNWPASGTDTASVWPQANMDNSAMPRYITCGPRGSSECSLMVGKEDSFEGGS